MPFIKIDKKTGDSYFYEKNESEKVLIPDHIVDTHTNIEMEEIEGNEEFMIFSTNDKIFVEDMIKCLNQ